MLCVAVLLVLAACSPSDRSVPEPPDYGPILNLSLTSDLVPRGGALVISANESREIFVYEYCGVPGALLKYERNAYRYVFPIEAACMEPENASFVDEFFVELDAIRNVSDASIGPGDYEFKVFYATVGPGVGVREANLFFSVGDP